MNFIITNNESYFKEIGNYSYCKLTDMVLPKKIAYDCETTGLNCLEDKIFAVQIGTGDNNYLIDLQESSPLFDNPPISITEVIPYLKGKCLVGHNIGFDLGFLYKNNFYPSRIKDTMIASMILHNGDRSVFSHSFGEVMEREMNLIYDKSEQKNIHKTKLSTTKAIKYCFNDVDRLLELSNNLKTKLTDYNAIDTYNLNCKYIKALTYLEMCGLPIDEKYWTNRIKQDKTNNLESVKEIEEYVFNSLPKYRNNQLDMFNNNPKLNVSLSSPKQMISVFKDLNINVIDDEGKESIDESVINKSNHEFVDIWLKYKESLHRLTTFGENILDKSVNGRLYTRFKPIVDTCRISSRKGEINFLNFPSDKDTRDCFRAKKGYKIIVCDFDNQESVTLADKSGNLSSLKSINEGADSHSILARAVFPELKDMSDDEIKKNHKDKRHIGKIANFTFAFGGNGYTAAKNLNISVEEGNKIYKAYTEINKEIFEWGETILKKAMVTGYIESADGFKLKLPYFDDFKKSEDSYKKVTKEEWDLYKQGKLLYEKAIEKEEKIPDDISIQVYLIIKPRISNYFKYKSKYFRLCLNSPIQSTAAHQTKKSMVWLFEYIKQKNHLWEVKIVNCVHDEIVLEVKEKLVKEYEEILGKIMREAANTYLKSGLVKMGAEAHSGDSWYEAK